MRSISVVLFFTFLAVCSAGPLVEQDFSITDENGGYHFGYNNGYQSRQEKRTPEGVVRGAYRYIDANGETQTITYTADDQNGFLASGSNIPKVPEVVGEQVAPIITEDTPEIKAAKAEVPSNASNTGTMQQQNKLPGLSQIGNFPIIGQIGKLPGIGQGGKLPGAGQIGQILPSLPGAFNPSQIIFSLLQQLIPRGDGYLGNINQGQPVVQYVIAAAPQYHPDYQPYAAL